jgi:DNA-binding transcriptional MerR regulator/mannose-6-phosphate isomerase-like protein (cupin superfamily)
LQFTISQVAKMMNVSPSTLRLWEQRGLARPHRTESGYRMYRSQDIERLKQIQQLRLEKKLNPDGIRHVLGAAPLENGEAAVETTGPNSVAARLRKLRRQCGLTLTEAAEGAGLSPSFLSCVERGQANASVASLQKLSVVYDTNVLAFFSKTETQNKLVRAAQRKSLTSDPGVRIELLAEGETLMEPHLFRIAPGASSGGSYHHEGEEFVYAVAGSCEFWLDEVEHYRLEAGDSLYFSSHQTHRWSNAGKVEAVLLWINTPPTF